MARRRLVLERRPDLSRFFSMTSRRQPSSSLLLILGLGALLWTPRADAGIVREDEASLESGSLEEGSLGEAAGEDGEPVDGRDITEAPFPAALELPSPDEDPETAHLSERHRIWLRQVEPLISRSERSLFLSLRQDYQRDAFIEEFWKPRDPYPRTARNELKERWPLRVAEARSRFGSLTDDRARVFLVHGPPTGGFAVTCTKRWSPVEIWAYERSEAAQFPFVLLFVQRIGAEEARVWRPDVGFELEATMVRARSCINGTRMQQVVTLLRRDQLDYERKVRLALAKPRPRSEEWIHTFAAFTTDVAEDAPRFDGRLEVAFPGRVQHRTVLQALVAVDASQLSPGEIGGYRSYELRMVGEVLKDGALFENFRYQFGFPETSAPETIPLAFQRRLRPGAYRMVLRIDDLTSGRVLRIDRDLEIPAVDELLPDEQRRFADPRSEALLAEATAALEAGESALRIVPPRGELLTGFVRFDTLTVGESIAKVLFHLDDQLLLTRNRPPWNVEIDLGAYPQVRRLRAVALDAAGGEVAEDEIVINGGNYRFTARLLEPRRGRSYEASIPVRVDVEIPPDRTLDRVEIFLDQERVAVLYQEPFVHPIVVPPGTSPTFVRAVAYLPDGNTTEDLAFVNAPEQLEQIDVQMVELYTTVLDGQGRPVEGLTATDFEIREDGVAQRVARFETVRDLPIHVAVMLDNSASMGGVLGEVRRAALSFFDEAIAPRDRAAVVTFNAFPHLATELTNDRTALGKGLAGLAAEGQTALWDSVMFSLYYLTGVKGQRAILLLSDGKDEVSRFDFERALDYARRAGVTIYTIAFGPSEPGARHRLARLAEETGGRSYALGDISRLGEVYSAIQRELRSQYLVAYQSSNASASEEFRAVQLEVDRPGVEVKTISGYYP